MRFRRAVAPAVPLLSLTEAKRWLRVTHTDAANDAEIEALVTATEAAMSGPEGLTGLALINQQWDFWTSPPTNDEPDVVVPFYPASALVEAEYLDADNATQTIDVADLILEALPRRTIVRPVGSWPTMAARHDALRLRITFGFGTAASDVPPQALQAAKLMLAHWYAHRSAVGPEMSEIPFGAQMLIDTFGQRFAL